MKEIECSVVERFAIELLAEKIRSAQSALQFLNNQAVGLLAEIVKIHGEDPKLVWKLTDDGKLVEAK